jgi:hypothetical protein
LFIAILFNLIWLLFPGESSSFSESANPQAVNTVEGQVFSEERKSLANVRVALLDDGYSQLFVVYTMGRKRGSAFSVLFRCLTSVFNFYLIGMELLD